MFFLKLLNNISVFSLLFSSVFGSNISEIKKKTIIEKTNEGGENYVTVLKFDTVQTGSELTYSSKTCGTRRINLLSDPFHDLENNLKFAVQKKRTSFDFTSDWAFNIEETINNGIITFNAKLSRVFRDGGEYFNDENTIYFEFEEHRRFIIKLKRKATEGLSIFFRRYN